MPQYCYLIVISIFMGKKRDYYSMKYYQSSSKWYFVLTLRTTSLCKTEKNETDILALCGTKPCIFVSHFFFSNFCFSSSCQVKDIVKSSKNIGRELICQLHGFVFEKSHAKCIQHCFWVLTWTHFPICPCWHHNLEILITYPSILYSYVNKSTTRNDRM